MPSDALITGGARPAVRIVRDLPDPPEVVWSAITDRTQLKAWFPCDVVVEGDEWKPGAVLTFVFPADVIDMTLTGKVLEVDEPHRLAYTWGDETLRFELASNNDGTRLTLIDELPPGIAARNAAGWEVCLDRLLGLDPPPDAWRGHFESYAAAFTPKLGEQEGPPAGYKGD
ncbi:MAG: SRPBCC domain-containing protein [Actinomycetes bacterium]